MSCVNYEKDNNQEVDEVIDSIDTCSVCGCSTDPDIVCRDCGEVVCDECVVPYDHFTQVDYTLCNNCGDSRNNAKAEYYEQ